jgi:hypothetical protein
VTWTVTPASDIGHGRFWAADVAAARLAPNAEARDSEETLVELEAAQRTANCGAWEYPSDVKQKKNKAEVRNI